VHSDKREALSEGKSVRGKDVLEQMRWTPLVTMWQVAADLPAAGEVPWGYGHLYSARDNLDSWVAVTQPENWSDEKAERLVELMAAHGAAG
jgi:uncharacterized membrane protein